MQADFTIEEVFNPKRNNGGTITDGLIFKIRWTKSRQVAFVSFDLIKRRYSHILLDYLASKIQLKMPTQIQNMEISSIKKAQPTNNGKQHSPVTNQGNYQIQQQTHPIKQFLCCAKKPKTPTILDYDSMAFSPTNPGMLSLLTLTPPPFKEGRKYVNVKKL